MPAILPSTRRRAVILAAICLFLLSIGARARQTRTPFHGTASLGGRQIERFVLLRTIHVNHPLLTRSEQGEFWILPGQFIPVSEDARGIYFQATNGFRVFAGNREPLLVPGGLYVSKRKPDEIFRYFGSAEKSANGVDIDSIPLRADYVRLLKVAHAATNK
ncbi:MAG TPA: hypothetical protein VGI85_05030 [Chthoniobacterales bacterium]|jgi:hypothetical protein